MNDSGYATSIDYDPKLEISIHFFKTIQNKMHWAAHGQTAAEVIYERVSANKKNIGLSNFKGAKPTKAETEIAKNYLNEDELNILNRMVAAYLDIAEIQTLDRKAMYMKDWIIQLDDFLKITGKDILQHAGIISHQQAVSKAQQEYEKYIQKTKNELSDVERHFIRQIDRSVKKIPKQ